MFTCRDCGAGVNDPEAHFCNVASRKSKKIIDLPPTSIYKNDDIYASSGHHADDTLSYSRSSSQPYRQEIESYVSNATYSSTYSDSRGPASMSLQTPSSSSPQLKPISPTSTSTPSNQSKGIGDYFAQSYNKLFNKGPSPPSNEPPEPSSSSSSSSSSTITTSNRMSRARPMSMAPAVTTSSNLIPLSDIMVFRDSKSVMCTECRTIFKQGEEFVKAGRAFYHTLCCRCTTCGLNVDEDQYGSDGWFKEGTNIECGDCMETKSGNTNPSPPSCDTCGRLVYEGSGVSHPKLPGFHHAACLRCQKCKRPMSERISETHPMHVKNGQPICHSCGAAHCSGCKKVIERNSRVCAALGKKYHIACFKCVKCGTAFPDKSFYVFDDQPHCQMCYHLCNGSICCGCETPIEGPCVSVIEGRFHPECFTCITCGELLADVYYAYDNQSYCEVHIRELQRSTKDARKAERRQTHYEKI